MQHRMYIHQPAVDRLGKVVPTLPISDFSNQSRRGEPMSYTRVMVMELPKSVSWADNMKTYRRDAVPGLKKLKKAKILKGWTVIQTGERSGMMVIDFANKANMNKYLKIMGPIRQQVAADSGMQTWLYHGPVKASG